MLENQITIWEWLDILKKSKMVDLYEIQVSDLEENFIDVSNLKVSFNGFIFENVKFISIEVSKLNTTCRTLVFKDSFNNEIGHYFMYNDNILSIRVEKDELYNDSYLWLYVSPKKEVI